MTSNQDSLYQLKVDLMDIRPSIWRRFQVPGSFSLFKLHRVLQVVMGWEDAHLHRFEIDGEIYATSSLDLDNDVIDEKKTTIYQVFMGAEARFIYEYDFGDYWRHEVLLEKIVDAETKPIFPVCLEGKRACPPEDCGGSAGYQELLEAVKSPKHPDHTERLEWLGPEFNPEAFDIDEINRKLRRFKP